MNPQTPNEGLHDGNQHAASPEESREALQGRAALHLFEVLAGVVEEMNDTLLERASLGRLDLNRSAQIALGYARSLSGPQGEAAMVRYREAQEKAGARLTLRAEQRGDVVAESAGQAHEGFNESGAVGHS